MLKTREVLEKLDIIDRGLYKDMIEQVNLPDFYKCIAQFSGLNMKEINDDTMVKYLLTWAKNKIKYFKMFGNKIQLDIPFIYKEMGDDRRNKYRDLENKYPKYASWIEGFKDQTSLKIDQRELDWDLRDLIKRLFPTLALDGTAITHFFKQYLKIEDNVITDIGRIYENNKIEATFTMSIDPVDIMLASENPYDWCSCYKLELNREDSHADGCMAAVLDRASIITYVWNRHGKFTLYNKYVFNDIRYKRMRMWIALSDDMKAIHFNSIYPGRGDYSDEFVKQLREMVETVIAEELKVNNRWKKNGYGSAYRVNPYGYSEYDSGNVYCLIEKDDEGKDQLYTDYEIEVFDEPIEDALGEGVLHGSYIGEDCDDYDEDENNDCVFYNGKGFLTKNYKRKYYCDRGDEYCEWCNADGLCTCPDHCEWCDDDEDEEEDD